MSLVYHERPGVYSSYDASSVIGRGTTERVIALVGKAEAKAGLYRLHSYSEAKEAFGEASELGRMAKIAYQNGAGTVLASPVAADALADYQAAFALIFAEKEASFCVAASSLETVQKALRDAVEAASAQNAECIGLVGLSTPSVKDLTDREGLYGHGKMFSHIVVNPGCSIGYHDHQHETEFYYILRGEAVFNDDGTEVPVHPGDICATGFGQHHALENRGKEPVELIALIVTE